MKKISILLILICFVVTCNGKYKICEPNTKRPCYCEDNRFGSKECNIEGDDFEACQCDNKCDKICKDFQNNCGIILGDCTCHDCDIEESNPDKEYIVCGGLGKPDRLGTLAKPISNVCAGGCGKVDKPDACQIGQAWKCSQSIEDKNTYTPEPSLICKPSQNPLPEFDFYWCCTTNDK